MKYIAFLRAVNVGGNSIIKMSDLKRIFESFGLQDVQTYIQSGNVIFESAASEADTLREEIEGQLEAAVGYRIQVFLRTSREVQSIAANSPFTATGNETVHIVFLNSKPGRDLQKALMSSKSEADDFAIKGREVYNLRRDREKSVFSNGFIEKTLKLPATTRNLTTLRKIAQKYG